MPTNISTGVFLFLEATPLLGGKETISKKKKNHPVAVQPETEVVRSRMTRLGNEERNVGLSSPKFCYKTTGYLEYNFYTVYI